MEISLPYLKSPLLLIGNNDKFFKILCISFFFDCFPDGEVASGTEKCEILNFFLYLVVRRFQLFNYLTIFYFSNL